MFPNRTTEGARKPPDFWSRLSRTYSNSERFILELMATTITSSRVLFQAREEIISAGRCLSVLKSVKGKGRMTTSPVLHSVIYRIFRVIPKTQRTLGKNHPAEPLNTLFVKSKIFLVALCQMRQKPPPFFRLPQVYLPLNLLQGQVLHMRAVYHPPK